MSHHSTANTSTPKTVNKTTAHFASVCIQVAVLLSIGTYAAAADGQGSPPVSSPPVTTLQSVQQDPVAKALQSIDGQLKEMVKRMGALERPVEATDDASMEKIQALEKKVESLTIAIKEEIPKQSGRLNDVETALQRLPTQQSIRQLIDAQPADASGDDITRLLFILSSVALLLLAVLLIMLILLQRKVAALKRPDLSPLQNEIGKLAESLKSTIGSEIARVASAEAEGRAGTAGSVEHAASQLTAVIDRLGQSVNSTEAKLQELPVSLNRGLEPAVRKLDEQAEKLDKQAEELVKREQEIEQSRAEILRQREEDERRNSEIVATGEALKKQADTFLQLLPADLLTGGVLEQWRSRLLEQAGNGDATAAELLALLMHWRSLEKDGSNDRDTIAGLLNSIGTAVHRMLPIKDGAHDEATLEAVQLWTKVFRESTRQRLPSLELKLVFPGDRFDTERMECAQSLSGNRLSVHEPLSWIIIDQSGDKRRILYPARVVTA